MEITPEIRELLEKLKERFDKDNQNLEDYLEGLYHNKYLDYRDYIQTDTLLSMQKPRTDIPDEIVFIVYHQITELFFKLTLHELEQIRDQRRLTKEFLNNRVHRMVNYFKVLTQSFSIMGEGLNPEQFMKFRISLLPASGFQSVQFRMIELASTPINNLVHPDKREQLAGKPLKDQLKEIYWKKGANLATTGEKSFTAERFEDQYGELLYDFAKKWQGSTLLERYQSLPSKTQNSRDLLKTMRSYDKYINVYWPQVHLKTAATYLKGEYGEKKGTGGTNWEKYLPPKIQKRIFFPELWEEKELKKWGK